MIDDDVGLVKRVLAGEKAVFGLLIDRYRPGAIKLARRILGDTFEAEDVTQEALLQAFLSLASLRNPDSFGPWLLGIVVNLSKMRIRARRDWHPAQEWHGGRVLEDFTLADLQPSPEAIYEVRELHEIVLAAVCTLPNDQQQAVRMHYIDGLSLWDIGGLAGVPVGVIKVRLHRARARLRTELPNLLGQFRESTPTAAEEVSMIEVTVHDVMLRAPKDDPEAEWLPRKGKKYKLGFTRVVLLKEQDGARILPIWVGVVEGDALAMLLADLTTNRPTMFELTTRLLGVAKMTLERVAVTTLRDDVYFATLWVRVRGKLHEVDARPSDALTLALRVKAPIFVTPELMEQASHLLLNPDEIPDKLETIERKYAEEKQTAREEAEMEWRSFRSLPRGNARGWIKPAEK
jgi:RNA polymerase sigma factor (sigma-70 family)